MNLICCDVCNTCMYIGGQFRCERSAVQCNYGLGGSCYAKQGSACVL